MARKLEWKIDLYLSEDEGTTRARAVLDTGTRQLTGNGTAHCNPQDVDVPEIGDEIAAGRAVQNLAKRIMKEADGDLEAVGAKAAPDLGGVPGWAVPGT